VGLRAWAIARLVEVKQPQGASKARGKAGAGASSSAAAAGVPSKVLLQRYYRPEDISKDTAYRWGSCWGSVPGAGGSAVVLRWRVMRGGWGALWAWSIAVFQLSSWRCKALW
jgi:hypothetical protein